MHVQSKWLKATAHNRAADADSTLLANSSLEDIQAMYKHRFGYCSIVVDGDSITRVTSPVKTKSFSSYTSIFDKEV